MNFYIIEPFDILKNCISLQNKVFKSLIRPPIADIIPCHISYSRMSVGVISPDTSSEPHAIEVVSSSLDTASVEIPKTVEEPSIPKSEAFFESETLLPLRKGKAVKAQKRFEIF